MDYLVLVGCLVLAAAFATYVGYPLFTRHAPLSKPLPETGLHRLSERKEQLYAAIKELEDDQTLGKLSAEDYQRLRSELEDQALAVIQQLAQHTDEAESAALHVRIEADVRAFKPPAQRAAYCGACGAERRSGDRFCPQCAAPFETGS